MTKAAAKRRGVKKCQPEVRKIVTNTVADPNAAMIDPTRAPQDLPSGTTVRFLLAASGHELRHVDVRVSGDGTFLDVHASGGVVVTPTAANDLKIEVRSH